jgi:hypothetical protein
MSKGVIALTTLGTPLSWGCRPRPRRPPEKKALETGANYENGFFECPCGRRFYCTQ